MVACRKAGNFARVVLDKVMRLVVVDLLVADKTSGFASVCYDLQQFRFPQQHGRLLLIGVLMEVVNLHDALLLVVEDGFGVLLRDAYPRHLGAGGAPQVGGPVDVVVKGRRGKVHLL